MTANDCACLKSFESLEQQLLHASREGHIDCVLKLSTASHEQSHLDEALQYAVINGHARVAEILMGAGANVDCAEVHCQKTPLIFAVENGHTEIVQKLLTLGADMECFDNHGCRAIAYAAEGDNTEIVQILQKAGANINCRNDDLENPLMIAVKNGKHEAVKELLKCGSDLDEVDGGDGWSALIFAVSLGHISIVRDLLGAGAQVDLSDFYGKTPLMYASEKGETEIVNILLQFGADPNEREESHNTPLMLAADYKHYDTARALLEGGADKGITMFWAIRHNHPKIVQILIDLGFALNRFYTRRIVQTTGHCIIARGINNGMCALAEAISADNSKIINLLLEAGANVNFGADEKKPLAVAVSKEQIDIVKLLLARGADVNHTDANRETALLLAASQPVNDKVHKILKILLLANADIRIHPPHTTSILDNVYFHKWKPRNMHYVEDLEPACISLLYAAGAPVTAATLRRFWGKMKLEFIPEIILDAGKTCNTLADACRRKIRARLLAVGNKKNLILGVPRLPLPKPLQEHLLFGVQCTI